METKKKKLLIGKRRLAVFKAGCDLVGPGTDVLPVLLNLSEKREVSFCVYLTIGDDDREPAPRRVAGLPPRKMWDVIVNVDTLEARFDI